MEKYAHKTRRPAVLLICVILMVLPPCCAFATAPQKPAGPTVLFSSIGDRYEEQTMVVTHKTNIFSSKSPFVHVVMGVGGLRKGMEVRGNLRAIHITDLTGVEHRNIEISSIVVRAVAAENTFHFEFSSPTKGWPLGTYAVNLEVEGHVINTTAFTVTEQGLADSPLRSGSSTDITQDRELPEIDIIEPVCAKNLRIEGFPGSTIRIIGYASDNEGIAAVYIKGKEVPLSEISESERSSMADRKNVVMFAGEALVKPGANTIDIQAVDVNGNTSKRTLSIARKSEGVNIITQGDLENARRGKRFALLIGISRYDSSEIVPLRYTLKDVQALYRVLTDPHAGGFAPENVKLLTDESSEKPTAANIGLGINWLRAMARQPEDLVFIYFSGHGYSDDNGSFLLTRDANPETLLTTCINVSIFNKMISQIPARKKIIILDACHSGGMSIAARGASGKMSREMYQALHDKSEGEIRFLSCRENEQSYEADEPGIQQGIFSYYLVKGLKGEADADKNGFVLFSELENYVQQQVGQWAALRGRTQTPVSEKKATGIIIMSEVKP